MIETLFNKAAFTQPIKYVISSYIREYDISKANINILFREGAINIDQYNYYKSLNNIQRKEQIGMLQRNDKSKAKLLVQGLLKVKREFLEANMIEYNDVLSIKNDAIFIINKIPKITQFDNINFIMKNIYTSFYSLPKFEAYYLYDSVNNIEKLDIKGIKDEQLLFHRNHFYEFLLVIFCSAQTESINETINLLTIFYNQYINRELEIDYYRPFNSESLFLLASKSTFSKFKAEFLEEFNKKHIDITHNLNILHELHGVLSEIYFIQNKK
jgi:hypothetical protein